MSLTLQGEKSLIAAGSVVALLTRSVARGRADEKIRTFCSEPQLLQCHIYSCLRCLRCNTLDNTLNCYPHLKRPMLHIKAVPKAIRERLSNKSIFTTLPLLRVTHENKGFKCETSLCEQGEGSILQTSVIFRCSSIYHPKSIQRSRLRQRRRQRPQRMTQSIREIRRYRYGRKNKDIYHKLLRSAD